jgi:hypothetical protein
LSAVAHQHVDEPQDDPAEEAAMSAADFRIIARAHQLCGHSPAVDLTVESDQRITDPTHVSLLLPHAIKILRSQIRAGELVREMAERGDLGVTETCLVELRLSDDETDEVEPPVNWKQAAQDAWHGESWKDAATDYASARMRR